MNRGALLALLATVALAFAALFLFLGLSGPAFALAVVGALLTLASLRAG